MTKIRFIVLALMILMCGSTRAHAITPPDTSATQAFMVDYDTGAVLYEKLPDQKMPTSSMSKVLTSVVVYDAIRSGKLSMDQSLPVSQKAWSMQGSKMFVDINTPAKVSDLIQGVVVQSGNDACIVLAEGLAGSEENFAEAMNQKAKEIGMTNSHFMNSTGWPDDNHYSTPRDLALLAKYLIKNYPEDYHYYSQIDFTYNNIKQGNRNPLLYGFAGGDGVKTGHTDVGGYGLIGSALRNGRRLILVINGTSDMQARADESRKLMEWGFASFRNIDLVQKGTIYAEAPVLLGVEKKVALTVADTVKMTVPSIGRSDLKMTAKFMAPLAAPIKAGDKVGTLLVTVPNLPSQEIPLVAATDVASKNFLSAAFEKLLLRIVGTPKVE